MNIRENVEAIFEAIRMSARRAGRSEKDIRLVGATKTVGTDQMLEAVAAGVEVFGENRIQEAIRKQDIVEWPKALQWHFIGHLQRNKVRMAIARFQMVQSLDSFQLAKVLNDHCESAGIRMPVLMEVNLGQEKSKGGFLADEVEHRARDLVTLGNLQLKGLMAIPPYYENPEKSRPYFRQLRQLLERLNEKGLALSELSMGMSHDFRIAIEEGATMVRIGTALFGERPVP